MKNDCLEHDEFFKNIFTNSINFPSPRVLSGEPLYVGEPYNGDDSLSNPEHRGLFK